LAKSNPQAPSPGDQRFDFTSGDDSDYLLEVTHLHSRADRPNPIGSRFNRRFHLELTLPNERFDVAPSGTAAVLVQVVRKGYAGPIELTAAVILA